MPIYSNDAVKGSPTKPSASKESTARGCFACVDRLLRASGCRDLRGSCGNTKTAKHRKVQTGGRRNSSIVGAWAADAASEGFLLGTIRSPVHSVPGARGTPHSQQLPLTRTASRAGEKLGRDFRLHAGCTRPRASRRRHNGEKARAATVGAGRPSARPACFFAGTRGRVGEGAGPGLRERWGVCPSRLPWRAGLRGLETRSVVWTSPPCGERQGRPHVTFEVGRQEEREFQIG